MCPLLSLKAPTLRSTLTSTPVPVKPHESLCNILRQFCGVVSSMVSVPTDYIPKFVFYVDVADALIYNTHIGFECCSVAFGRCPVALCVLSLVALGVGGLPCPSCIDCLTVGALSLCGSGVIVCLEVHLSVVSPALRDQLKLHSVYPFHPM